MVYQRPQTVTHPSTNPAAHGREWNSGPVDHKSDALTITLLQQNGFTVTYYYYYYFIIILEFCESNLNLWHYVVLPERNNAGYCVLEAFRLWY